MSDGAIFSGEDVIAVPEPLTERPPTDRFCDLVLTGGVASGVVYPWAILELARSFRFKNIGGTSVGAMAAALAAAAEYGRRNGYDKGFEVLRRLPGALAEELPDRRGVKTRLASLFQPEARAQRLFDLFFKGVQLYGPPSLAFRHETGDENVDVVETGSACRSLRLLWSAVWSYRGEVLKGAIGLMILVLIWPVLYAGGISWSLLPAGIIGTVAGALIGLILGVLRDIRAGLVDNDLGLCRGFTNSGDPDERPGLIQWLHNGVQKAAGLDPKLDRPLTFADLWNAPQWPGAAPSAPVDAADVRARSINLEMITTNVTLGRPFRLPLRDQMTRLYFRVDELSRFFPPLVMKALVEASNPYRPEPTPSPSDLPIPVPQVRCARWADPLRTVWNRFRGADKGPVVDAPEYRELPGAGMPIVVAARLSLSFPLLFSAVPLYAIDFKSRERDEGGANVDALLRCWFTDGGLSSNFPINLFDAALPRWPTFGMWLGKFNPRYPSQPVWLPKWGVTGQSGGGDSWQHFDPQDPWTPEYAGEPNPGKLGFLARFLVAAAVSAKDWQDRSSMRMPHVRGRVARLALRPGEGELNIAMSRSRIVRMANRYGVAAGKEFTDRFVAADGETAAEAWTHHRKLRLLMLVQGLRGLLAGVSVAADHTSHTIPIEDALRQEKAKPGTRSAEERPLVFTPDEGVALSAVLEDLKRLEHSLDDPLLKDLKRLRPTPDLRLRPRI